MKLDYTKTITEFLKSKHKLEKKLGVEISTNVKHPVLRKTFHKLEKEFRKAKLQEEVKK